MTTNTATTSTDVKEKDITVKNDWFVILEETVETIKEKAAKANSWLIENCCPASLRNFNEKYPHLGQLKDDMLSIIKFVFIRALLVTIVIPAAVVATCIFAFRKIKGMFKKKEVKND